VQQRAKRTGGGRKVEYLIVLAEACVKIIDPNSLLIIEVRRKKKITVGNMYSVKI
jgi:hypothetical protein